MKNRHVDAKDFEVDSMRKLTFLRKSFKKMNGHVCGKMDQLRNQLDKVLDEFGTCE